MGDEMAEMMSQEITRVMEQQRHLEKEYARLVTLRSDLKGLSNKHKLQEIRGEILTVAKQLKESTRTLCRQLQDNPDVDGNQRKIKQDKVDLMVFLEQLNAEMRELSYAQFKGDIKAGLDAQGEFERLRTDEKDLNQQIKRLNEDFKRAQDDYAKEANENNQEILQLKKQVNETKTEKELYVQYRARETDGKLGCQRRIFDKEKERLNERIKLLEEQLTTEKLVSERIRKFLQQKAEILSKKADEQDRVKDQKVDQITRDREEIYKEKAGEEDAIKEVSLQIQGEEDEKGRRDRDERDRQDELDRKRQEKMDMEDAARYIQRKWKWFQEVGKHLAKKKKGKKGKGKKKK